MNVVIYESFVGISFFVSDFDSAKSGIEKYRMFRVNNDFIFIENQTKNRKSDSNEKHKLTQRFQPFFRTLISYLDA